MKVKPEYQGEGTYRYECRKQDCLYCVAMGLTPEPVEYFEEETKPERIPIYIDESTGREWSPKEQALLVQYYKRPAIVLKRLFPMRSMQAIYSQRDKYKKMGIINTDSIYR